jgi:hypothetical protein
MTTPYTREAFAAQIAEEYGSTTQNAEDWEFDHTGTCDVCGVRFLEDDLTVNEWGEARCDDCADVRETAEDHADNRRKGW